MFERILVALDGSAASELALPGARSLAKTLGSTLILAHIVEARPPRAVHGEPHLSEALSAAAYLEEKAAGLRAAGIKTETHVHETAGDSGIAQRDIAASIAGHAAELGFDLAVMAVHGRRGALDRLVASLPFRVAASGCAPVYLARSGSGPGGRGAAEGPWQAPRAILLPLDGRAAHEAAVPQAVALARAFRVPVEILGVVPRRASDAQGGGAILGRLNPALDRASLEYAAEGTAAYLKAMASRLSAEGIEARWNLERGRPAAAILRRAAALRALIVLSTHRKLGLDATLDGCVAYAVATAYEGDSLVAPVAGCL